MAPKTNSYVTKMIVLSVFGMVVTGVTYILKKTFTFITNSNNNASDVTFNSSDTDSQRTRYENDDESTETDINFNIKGHPTSSGDNGSACNVWREPVCEIGEDDNMILRGVVEKMSIKTTSWRKYTSIMDKVVQVVVNRMKERASQMYPGLILDENLIRQGSIREGMKVTDAREFDYILPFRIEGMSFENMSVYNRKGCKLPGLIKRKVIVKEMQKWIQKNKILYEADSEVYLNSKNLQKAVFASIIDSCRNTINMELSKMCDEDEKYRFLSAVTPPTLKIRIEIEGEKGFWGLDEHFNAFKLVPQSGQKRLEVIDVDIVPGMLLAIDRVPDQFPVYAYTPKYMECHRFTVMKWANSKSQMSFLPDNVQDIVWRDSSCGYEKHIFDICRKNKRGRLIMTACRVLKFVLAEMRNEYSKNQIPSILQSYHLKNLCLYCLLFLTIPYHCGENKISSVNEVLGYFVKFIELSLESGNLPHFFYGNPWISQLFPGCPYENEKEKLNLFENVQCETLNQCRLRFEGFVMRLPYMKSEEDIQIIKKYKDHCTKDG